ncbi:hypothetical protein FQA39_LY06800 [Lamprigera yunnana]|nr:hypothetical protein FQA39_LY06800 [Lamprigera yunnana]
MVRSSRQRGSNTTKNGSTSKTENLSTNNIVPTTPTKQNTRAPVDVTPPKQKKMNENSCPTTPLTLLNKMTLNSPHKQLQNVRRALHSSVPTRLPGRDKELKQLKEFIITCIKNETSGSLYISGPPGTGKTAALSLILEDTHIELKKVFINCTAVKSSDAIYARIVKDLELKPIGRTKRDYLNVLEQHLTKTHKMILLVLDEIDQLDSKNQSVLYTIFEWPSKVNSKLILIGIANALDLTDRILPLLQIRCELKPQLMHFSPYTKQQIIEIFMDRLQELHKIFSPVAIQLLAGKVAAVSGDVRRALDIGRRVLELTEQNLEKHTVLKSKENIFDNLPTVDLKAILGVLNGVYGTSQNLNEESDNAIPLQQRIIICSLLLMMKNAKNKDITIGKLHEVYKRVCVKRNFSAVDQAEFGGICSLIETRGIIQIIGKKEPRLHKVSMQWDEEEVADVLKDKELLSSILEDKKCVKVLSCLADASVKSTY